MTKPAQRLRREIYVWRLLKHPHVLPMLGMYIGAGDHPALVSPWCEHGDINSYLRTQRDSPQLLQLMLKLVRIAFPLCMRVSG